MNRLFSILFVLLFSLFSFSGLALAPPKETTKKQAVIHLTEKEIQIIESLGGQGIELILQNNETVNTIPAVVVNSTEPKLLLTLADALDILADYTIIYDSSPTFCVQYWGLTEYTERRIRVCGSINLAQRRAVLIHEMLHAVSFTRSIDPKDQYTEAEIEEAVKRIYKELYGVKRN